MCDTVIIEEFEHLRIELGAIELATNSFSDGNCIGWGGFGNVYKGELGDPKRMVAVKRLVRQRNQGNKEFWKEIMMLSRYKHENIVSLLGFCDENGEMLLVYEYASNKSLDFYLDGVSVDNNLTWIQRLNICLDAARGLEYLHDPKDTQKRILHRDVKSSNILLDDNWKAKISDFGLSRECPANQQTSIVVTGPVGTNGYCDPLYAKNEILTKESDVYSFGVVLFEVLCGKLCFRRNPDENQNQDWSFAKWVRQSFDHNKLNDIVDNRIKVHINPDSLKPFATTAYNCLNIQRKDRPTMPQIVKQLKVAIEFQLETALRNDLGKLQFGCKHYRSRCELRASCCNNQIFPCRRCHEEYTCGFNDPKEMHKMVFEDGNEVVCKICHMQQQAVQICCNCRVIMGEYFCETCKLYDDDTSKQHFHCDGCGICRIGGRENFFHCYKCGGCYEVKGRDSHACSPNALRIVCPVCQKDHFDAAKATELMHCGHAIHLDCYPKRYPCPFCRVSKHDNQAG